MIRAGSLFGLCVAAIASAALPALAPAQTYPTKPITIIVPWPPGGSVDVSARSLGKELSELLGQNIVIDNRGGAAGSVGSAIGARAAKDGYTLTFGNATSHATNLVTIPTLSYNPITDFAAISLVHKSTMSIAVTKSSPIKTFAELMAYAKAHPGVAFGTPGIGSPQHLIGELLNQKAGLALNHVPYRGGGPVVNDLVGGHIPVGIGGLSQFLALHERGDVRIVAIADERRHPALPDVPTLSETFADIKVSGWGALYAPQGTDAAVLARLGDAVRKGIASDDFRKVTEGAGLTPASSSPEELISLMQADIALWRDLAKRGIRLHD
jgi:tripartite-type tricarboxylate transporter receptor subunit TctC